MIYQSDFAPIYSLLSSKNLFIVPTFQRPFRWETKHISTLVTDISKAKNKQRDHYLSPIHLIQINTTKDADIALLNLYTDDSTRPAIDAVAGGLIDDDGIPVSVYMIIDGQQRLTATLAILKAFNVPPPPYSITIRGRMYPKLIAGSQAEDTEIRRGLGIINGAAQPLNAAASRIQSAFTEAANLAANMPPARLFTTFLQQRLTTLAVCLDPLFALGSFLTLNDRGKSLTTLEKLKAHCMYLDSLAPHPNPHQVHDSFGALYHSLEQTDSVLTDGAAVQVATLFQIQGVQFSSDVINWGADSCLEDVLTHPSDPANLGNNLAGFLDNITRIANANDTLAEGLRGLHGIAEQDAYRLALQQRPLSHRALAIVMQFHALHHLPAAGLTQPLGRITLNSNVDVARYLNTELGRQGSPSPALQSYHQQVGSRITALGGQAGRQISVLELAVMVDACGVKAASFLYAWNQVFAGGQMLQDSFDCWVGYLQNWNSRFNYLRDLLSPGDVSPSSLRYKVMLLKEASHGRYWPTGTHHVEHIFAVNLLSWGNYGFAHIADYQAFCNKIGNIVPLDKALNTSIGANDPATKANYYINQTTLSSRNCVPNGMTPTSYSPTAVQLGQDIALLRNLADQRAFIDIRNIDMVSFAASVI